MSNNLKRSDFVWAKSSENGEFWSPLWLHLRDTMQVSSWIWDNRMAQKHKDMLVYDLGFSEDKAKSLFMILCGLHDLGKSTPDFSGRDTITYSTAPLYLRMKQQGFDYGSYGTFRKKRGENSGDQSVRHEVASEFYIMKLLAPENAKYTGKTVLSIISAHHGKPLVINSDSAVTLPTEKSSMADLPWIESVQDIYNFIMDSVDGSREILSESMQIGLSWRTQMVYAGYLSMADWIASSDENFPLLEFSTVEPKSWEIYPLRLDNALATINFPSIFDSSKISSITDVSSLFDKRFGFSTPRPTQRELVDLVSHPDTDASDIFILEAPMGEGKTEAALVAAEILMAKSKSTGFFFGLPTMATGEAIYGRVEPYLTSLLKETNQNATMDLAHSKAIFSSTRERIDGKAYYNHKDSGLVSSGWLAGRYLKTLNSFVVGTVDNLLMMQLKAKYGYWRHLGFSQKVLIIDEVHSMDEVMKHYLSESLRMAGFYGCPVILCSATLQEKEREAYINVYNEGKKLGEKIDHGSN